MKKLIFFLVVATIATVNVFGQAIPKQISYQGVLKDASGLVNGDQALTFKIYNEPTGGTPLWTEIQVITVTDGLFNAFLGSSTPITGVPFDRIHFLGIQVGSGAELTPRTLLTPTPYSFMAMDVMDNTVTTTKIVDATITGTDIANNTIGPEKLNFTPGTGTIGGSGTANYIPIFTANTTLGNSAIYQTGNNIGIGTLSPQVKLDVVGAIKIPMASNVDNNSPSLLCNLGDDFLYNGKYLNHYGFGFHRPLGFSGSEVGSYISGWYGVDLFTGGTNRLTITNAGYVGIGTTSPTAQLHALHTSGTYGRIATTLDGVNGYTNVSGGYAIYGVKGASASYAGYFSGAVHVAGALSKSSGSFKIDHPLDPANKYLYHSFVESPDMMNIYNGNIVTDGSGYATITLPEWFEALNKDFRYQLTVIGDFAQAIISQKVQNNQFTIRTDKPNVEVSWQVTGIRKDAWAEKNRIPIEESKKGHEVGRYIHPEVYGLPETLSIEYERNKLESEKTPE